MSICESKPILDALVTDEHAIISPASTYLSEPILVTRCGLSRYFLTVLALLYLFFTDESQRWVQNTIQLQENSHLSRWEADVKSNNYTHALFLNIENELSALCHFVVFYCCGVCVFKFHMLHLMTKFENFMQVENFVFPTAIYSLLNRSYKVLPPDDRVRLVAACELDSITMDADKLDTQVQNDIAFIKNHNWYL